MGDNDRAVRALIANSYVGDVGELDQDDLEEIVNIVLAAYRAGRAATPDGPRRWALPDEPGPEVTAVRDRDGHPWEPGERDVGHGSWFDEHREVVMPWYLLVTHYGPLTDATPAADGQEAP